MSRELKFRAWDKGRRCMLNVDELMWDRGAVTSLWMGRHDYLFMVEVLADEVDLMQFTGLRDSQGHEIYEGDILRLTGEKEMLAVVEFADGAFKARSGPDSVAWLDFVLAAADERRVVTRVVGNRFENPEMLEGLTCE